jgi:hypothetical protein
MLSRKKVLTPSLCAVAKALNLSLVMPSNAAWQNIRRKSQVQGARLDGDAGIGAELFCKGKYAEGA